MNAQHVWWGRLALTVLVAVALVGGWEMTLGSGAFTPQAQAADDKDKKKDFDHFACYEVKCVKYDKGGPKKGDPEEVECPKEYDVVTLFNQFTDKDHDDKFRDDKDGVKVIVGKLKLLCAPTKKDHKDHHDKD
jgi:hypothetical protein